MLERVPTQSQSVSAVNPISNAISWKIPVYSVDVFQSWLDKKLSQIQLIPDQSEPNKNSNAKVFTKRFLKVESLVKNKYRPEFREVSRWPSLHINTLAGSCPFDRKSSKKSAKRDRNHADKKKESDRMNRTCNKVTNESGYCEICAVHYKDLSQHVTESTHMKFVCNDKNYADLDNCIKTRSVEAFLATHNSSGVNYQTNENTTAESMGRNLRRSVSLHLNNNNENSAVTKVLTNSKLLDESVKQPLQVQCNGFTNYHLRKTSIKSDGVCYDGKDLLRESRKMYASCPDSNLPSTKDLSSHLSPLEDDTLHRLRSRRNLILPSILIGTTAEDANRHRGISSQTTSSNHNLRSSVSPKSCTYATRSKLHNHVGEEEEVTYRKVFHAPVSASHVVTTPNRDSKNSIASGAHFTRSKLNNLSPLMDGDDRKMSPKQEYSLMSACRPQKRRPSVTSDDDEHQLSTVPGYPATKKFKIALCNDLSHHQISALATEKSHQSHRKRMSIEEKFLEDNKEYYKVEMLRTKLRSTESYCNREFYQVANPRKEELKPGAVSTEIIAPGSAVAAKTTESDEAHQSKFSKRSSALQLLNLEAENFMFGPPKNERSDTDENDDDDVDDRNVNNDKAKVRTDLGESKGERVKEIVENGIADDKDQETRTNGFTKQNGRRGKGKKRRTHAELFIHDNLDYYKFEISGSRLRHHTENGSNNSVKSETNSCSSVEATTSTGITKIKEEIMTDDESEVTFTASSGRRPSKVGKKKDVAGDNHLHDVSNSIEALSSHPTDVVSPSVKEELGNDCTSAGTSANLSSCCAPSLPPPESICFTFESVPCKEPWYKAFQRYDACDEKFLSIPDTVYFTRYRDIHPLSSSRRAEKQLAALAGSSKDVLSNSSVGSNCNNNSFSPHFRLKRRTKIVGGRIVIDDKPRKSPRCHASTLAILSSLTSHRRRSRKLHMLEVKKSGSVIALKNSGAVLSADLDNKTLTAELSQEYQRRLNEAISALASDADEHFIDVFSRDDCEDRYLSSLGDGVGSAVTAPTKAAKQSETSSNEWHRCLQIDENILQDEEMLKWFADGNLYGGSGEGGGWSESFGDMATFMESAQRCCTSMETAAEEEWSVVPRQHHDTLARLCRENDFSCNSSDCGASSTCEFLGFSEDGQSVSRKRKRKRPNMTGWPHDRNKRRHMRFLERRRTNVHSSIATADVAAAEESKVAREAKLASNEPLSSRSKEATNSGVSAAATIARESTVSEADSECTDDDDVPLTQILGRKKRRTNSTTTASEECPSKEGKATSTSSASTTPKGGRRSKFSHRRSKNSSPSKASPLPYAGRRRATIKLRRRGRIIASSRRNR